MNINFAVNNSEVIAKIVQTHRKFKGFLPFDFDQHGLKKIQNCREILINKLLTGNITTDLKDNKMIIEFEVPNGTTIYNYKLTLVEDFEIDNNQIINVDLSIQELISTLKNKITYLEKKIEDLEDRISRVEYQNNSSELY